MCRLVVPMRMCTSETPSTAKVLPKPVTRTGAKVHQRHGSVISAVHKLMQRHVTHLLHMCTRS